LPQSIDMKQNIIISIGLLAGACTLSQSNAIAQDEITKELLARESGVWLSESTNTEGEKINNYSWYWHVDELELARGVHLAVNSETKKLISTLHVYTSVNESGKQTESLFFNSEGNVGTSVGIFNGNVNLIRFQGVNTNNIIFSGTIRKELSEDGETSNETWSDLIFNGNYVVSTPKREHKKLEATNLRPLFQEGKILPAEEANTAKFLEPFQKLIGRWEMKNKDGDVALKIQWRMSGIGRILIENWAFFNEKGEQGVGGVNVTGIDPSSGRLTMWSVGKNGFSRSGGWDFISDNVTGQRQGNNRLIRKLEDDNTITAYWQSKKNGEYTGEDDKYTLKRVLETE